MVGVAGRSKGCNTCRRRKVKCDEGKPTCARCEKAGFGCDGYERPIHFRIMSTTPILIDEPVHELQSQPQMTPPVPASVPGFLSIEGFRGDMQFAFLFDNFVWSSYGSPWLHMAAEGNLNPISFDACRAFSQCVFAKHHGIENVQTQSALIYGSTLTSLITRLGNPDPATSATLLIPVMVLLMYSSSENDLKASYFHVMGLFKILQVSGPAAFSTPPIRNAFEACRSTLTIVGILQKQRLFLENPEWLTMPWPNPEEKSSQNRLTDILVKLPGLLEDESSMLSVYDPQKKYELLTKVLVELEKLFRWRWEWELQNPGCSTEVSPDFWNPTQPIARSRVFDSTLIFRTFTQAAEICLYNAVLLCLLGLLWNNGPGGSATFSLAAKVAQSTIISGISLSPSSPLKLPGMVVSPRDAAVEICRSFEFQLLNAKGSREVALFWLFPLGLAHKVLEDEKAYSTWIMEMLGLSVVTRGYGTGKNAFGFGFYKLPKMV